MKICICTTPIRSAPSAYPPFGSMAIIQAIRKIGKQAQLYNADYLRPKREDIMAFFGENQFDIVGISAVVSTAYAYTKYLTQLIRSVSPETVIIVGGNMAASAEILLRKCNVNYCVVGNGELIVQDLVLAMEKHSGNDENAIKDIQGICFLDKHGKFIFTGYRNPPSAEEIEWADYTILQSDGSLSYYIKDTPEWYIYLGFEVPPQMRGKRTAIVQVAKGCPNRCTFCHRWERGYRARPVDQIVEHIQHLKDRYNVGFISMGDESFGTNRKTTLELASHLGEMGIIWRANGVRARSVDRDILMHWKANGCVAVGYGIESGSQVILDVMEKNTTVEMNINAIKWTYEASLVTIIQLVLGMPGETDQTIQETINFLKTCIPYYPTKFRGHHTVIHSTCYAQALPGSPLYEYARQNGFIGKTIDEEEKYLLKISDTDAYETDHYVNYTRQPLLKVLMWRPYLSGEINAYYLKYFFGISLSFSEVMYNLLLYFVRIILQKRWGQSYKIKIPLERDLDRLSDKETEKKSLSCHSNLSPVTILFLNSVSRKWVYPLFAFIVGSVKRSQSPLQILTLMFEQLRWSITSRFFPRPDLPKKSLRKLIVTKPPASADEGSEEMTPLRLGR